MEGCSSASLPDQVLFFVQFWDQEWNEIMKRRRWTNDVCRIMTLYEQLRHKLWAESHGMSNPYNIMEDVFFLTVEVTP
jgi:hypothetical protein